MKAKLVSRWGAEKGAEFWVEAEAAIGRGADNDVRLEAKPVSSQHARVFFDPEAGAYFLEDLGSLNGTEIDGTPVARTERLGRLHVLNFGGVCEMLFITVDTDPAAEAKPSESDPPAADEVAPVEGTRVDAEPPALPDALAAGGERGITRIDKAPVVLPEGLAAEEKKAEKAEPGSEPEPDSEPEKEPERDSESDHVFVLAVIEKGKPNRFPLREGENLVGRSKGAAVALASRQLSRRHAMLTVEGDRVTVRDLGSRNHTFVGDLRVGAEPDVEVEIRSRLRFGLLEAYLLRHDDDDRTIPIEVSEDR